MSVTRIICDDCGFLQVYCECVKITSWQRFNSDTGAWVHNHIQDGHVEGDKPTGEPHQTANWAKGEWKKEYKHLVDNRVG